MIFSIIIIKCDSQHDDTQRNGRALLIMLSVTCKPFMQRAGMMNVDILSVFMLSVVASLSLSFIFTLVEYLWLRLGAYQSLVEPTRAYQSPPEPIRA